MIYKVKRAHVVSSNSASMRIQENLIGCVDGLRPKSCFGNEAVAIAPGTCRECR